MTEVVEKTSAPVAAAAAADSALEVRALSKAFGTRKALDSLSFELPTGAFLAICGANGAGKTTLLRILATLARPSSGSVSVLGCDIKEQPDEVRARIGFISHRSMLYPDLTAEENLLLAARLYGVVEPQTRVSELLAAVELTARRYDLARSFSRGMTQRLAIARALIHDPQLVLLDEPYTGLDPHASEIFDALLATQRASRSFVLVSHDLRKGFELASHLLLLNRGKLELFAPSAELDFASFSQLYYQTVGG
ncbi:MAG: heme ABC exporter ATP-binding protein CcmA [Coriobacteriales bacterium]|nr:heme ABC exporter ATP-binding protein CcmA [Coriobacteriales bacterium]